MSMIISTFRFLVFEIVLLTATTCRKEVTFLYKLSPGVCPKSYGMNVARMAGIPDAIVQEAHRAAEHFESEHLTKRAQRTENIRHIDSIQREGFLYAWHSLMKSMKTFSPDMRRGIISVMKSWMQHKVK